MALCLGQRAGMSLEAAAGWPTACVVCHGESVAGRPEFAERLKRSPLAYRLGIYVAAFTTTASIYLWTQSETVQLLGFAIFCVAVVPLLDRFVRPHPAAASTQDDYEPSRWVRIAGLTALLCWGVVAIFLLPDPGLGLAVWLLVYVVPALECYLWLVERDRYSTYTERLARR